jgi:V/A-type H+-transporting ATPase subunit D
MSVSQKRMSANRMTLMQLRDRLEKSSRGHKLLKDKLDELLRVFLERIQESRNLRTEVERRLHDCYSLMALAYAQTGEEALDEALATGETAAEMVNMTMENVMTVKMPFIEVKDIPSATNYSYALTPMVLDGAISSCRETLPLMIELAQREKGIELLALKIEATRRRVNALEHVLIPQLETSIRTVRMKIDENERDDRTRIVKVKEMLASEER